MRLSGRKPDVRGYGMTLIQTKHYQINPITEDDLNSVLEVYRQCEDFLALGPQPHASMEMVLADLEVSRMEGGVFCGIWDQSRTMVGVVDFIPESFQGNPHHAFLSLLMIPKSYRKKGIGAEIATAVEHEISKNTLVTSILSAVQTNNDPAIRFWQKMGYRIVSGPEPQKDGTITYKLQKDSCPDS